MGSMVACANFRGGGGGGPGPRGTWGWVHVNTLA